MGFSLGAHDTQTRLVDVMEEVLAEKYPGKYKITQGIDAYMISVYYRDPQNLFRARLNIPETKRIMFRDNDEFVDYIVSEIKNKIENIPTPEKVMAKLMQ